jgi:acetylornithine deacetylase/succinyl-diaminopimelate desuccinylase-like protein
VRVSVPEVRGEPLTSPPLTPQIMAPIEKLSAEMWPGVPVVPVLQTGATDGQFITPAGIPTYGVSGLFGDRDGDGVHGLNERIRIKSLMDGRTFLYRLVKVYADQ